VIGVYPYPPPPDTGVSAIYIPPDTPLDPIDLERMLKAAAKVTRWRDELQERIRGFMP
jgi:hypothetical protein